MRPIAALALLMVSTTMAAAVGANECERQRAQYPAKWNDVSHEKGLFDCRSHYAGALRIKLGARDNKGRTLMSLVPLKEGAAGPVEDTSDTIYRIWLDKEQLEHLQGGKYFATIVRKETSCWIRGDLDEAAVFFMDNANPPDDRPDAGSFYNKAPRFSVFEGNAYYCNALR